MKNIYLVYIKDNKEDYFYAEPMLNLLRGNNSLIFNQGIDKDDILEKYNRKVTINIIDESHIGKSLDNKKFYIPSIEQSDTIEYKLVNVVVKGLPLFEMTLVEDLLDCDHKFWNLFLISSDKKELNRVARELKDKMTVGTKPTFYSINLSKAHIKNIKED